MKTYSLIWREKDGTVGRLGDWNNFRERGEFKTLEEAEEARVDMQILHPNRDVSIQIIERDHPN